MKSHLVECGIASLTLPGQEVCGDMYLVKVLPEEVLVAVVDGVGHGAEAATAARIAIKTLEGSPVESLIGLVYLCDEELRFTRGVVMSLARFKTLDNTMTWLGVGNVEGFLLHRNAQVIPGQQALLTRAGVVGDHLPRLAASIIQVTEGDLLIFATDGIQPGFADNLNLSEPPQQIADGILARFGRGADDALVLVVRYVYGQDKNSFR